VTIDPRFGEFADTLAANANKLDQAFYGALTPPPRIPLSEWAANNREFPDDAPIAGKWRNDKAPYLVEIMDDLTPHDPCEEVDVIKCSQSGGTASAENLVGYVADVAPGPAMYIGGTFQAALDWAAEKLWPMIRATDCLNPEKKGAIREQNARDGEGSIKKRIVFRRSGYLLLAGANSAASLRQHTIRYAIEDDLDQFEDDLEGQGSPESMVDSRIKVFHRLVLSKRLKISTPTIKGASKIGAAYEATDRRRYYLKCQSCGSRFDPIWTDIVWPDGKPNEAYLAAPCCGSVHEHWQKAAMSLVDGWLPTREIEGFPKPPRHMNEQAFQERRRSYPPSKRRGYHITGIISAFQTWAYLAQKFVEAQGDQSKLKAWTNLELGEMFELRGGTPDYEKLQALREQHWGRGQAPVGAIVATMGCDVQGDGIYYEKLLWGANAESWSYDVGFLPGATDIAGEGAWADLDKIAKQPIIYPGGKKYPLDQICVDAGYHTAAAEAFCKAHPNRLAIFGRAGWTLPVLGRGENLRYETQGKRTGQAGKRMQDKAYIVGTFGIKLTLYGYLRSTIKAAADESAGSIETRSRGRCHFNRDAPDEWFEQITSETVISKTVNGYVRREWAPLPGRQNHWLDCRVYNHAAAEKLKLDTLNESDWARLNAERTAAPDARQGDLLDALAKPQGPTASAPAAAASPQPSSDWIETREGYL
jgi:phage terminase large subunit GpA-like protein